MAHAVQPNHRPHEQLRTEPPSQREHSEKYVSAFVTGSAQVEMSFRNPILPKSADHFKVGVDELTVNLGNLSMLEYGENDVLFRVLRRGNNLGDLHENFRMIDGPIGNLAEWRNGFEFKIDRPFLTMLEILDRCREVAIAVGTYMRNYGLAAGVGWTLPQVAGTLHEFFRVDITPNGQLRFSGNKMFWANFTIEVPLQKYRQIIFKDHAQQYVSLHPGTGNEIAAPYTVVGNYLRSAILNPVWDGNLGDLNDVTSLQMVGDGNLLHTLDRRVTLEVGCSLPIKNSPLVDHGVEAPDFILGRYMFHQPYSMEVISGSLPNIVVPYLGAVSVQGPRDRIIYHHLKPQQKIQILRLKLWARVRTYDETKRTWGMKTIVCPVEAIDYWHIRMHFAEK